MPKWDEELAAFADEQGMRLKGGLCVALHVTRLAREKGLPLDSEGLITDKGGQVLGLGRARVQSILGDHGITAVLAEEGARTSRGSLGNMRAYVSFLNKCACERAVDLKQVEGWWIERVKEFFQSKPFILKFDPKSSLRVVVRDLLKQAESRQKEGGGTMYLGAMLQHLVGAKLELVLGVKLPCHGSCVSDMISERNGDFLIGDVVIHVTTSPGEALMRKCVGNLDKGLRPLIITTRKGATAADVFADETGIADRVDVFEAEQFLAGNLFELSKFLPEKRRSTAVELVEHYNEMVQACETDPSLRIRVND